MAELADSCIRALGRFCPYILLVTYYLYYTSILSIYLGTLGV